MLLMAPLAGHKVWERGGGKVKLWVLLAPVAPLQARMGQLLPLPELPNFPVDVLAVRACG